MNSYIKGLLIAGIFVSSQVQCAEAEEVRIPLIGDEGIVLSEDEPLTQASWKDVITEAGLPYTVAAIKSGDVHHFFDAELLEEWFKKGSLTNPMTGAAVNRDDVKKIEITKKMYETATGETAPEAAVQPAGKPGDKAAVAAVAAGKKVSARGPFRVIRRKGKAELVRGAVYTTARPAVASRR